MSRFLRVKTVREVLAIAGQIKPLGTQTIPIEHACGRVLCGDIRAGEPVPHFERATMDGYAVRSRDTFGASESLPALLDVSGEVFMGEPATVRVEPGKAVAIPTGGMLPEGADAVVMVEYTSGLDDRTIEVSRPVAPGENVLKRGEEIAAGEELFHKGRRLLPQDIGVLAALGIGEAGVYRRPRVAVMSSGDEIVPAQTRDVAPGKIRDVNTFTLACRIARTGALVTRLGVAADRLDTLVSACRDALSDHDVLVLSGGSSVGARDFTIRVLEGLPGAELLVHGAAIRPGKPTILARAGEKLFWGLPGQPVSAMIVCQAFVLPFLAALEGEIGGERPEPGAVKAVLSRQIPSVHGRTDYVPVLLSEKTSGPWTAEPVFGRSAMISVLARAHGYIVIPEHAEGLDRGAEVEVHLF